MACFAVMALSALTRDDANAVLLASILPRAPQRLRMPRPSRAGKLRSKSADGYQGMSARRVRVVIAVLCLV
jgi:hypothetical protein